MVTYDACVATPTDAQILAAAKSALYGTLTRGAESYTTEGGRSLTSLSTPELQALISEYEIKVARAAGSDAPLAGRFGSAS